MRLVQTKKKDKDMTTYINSRQEAREARTPVSLPNQTSTSMFQGWGPKF